VKGTTVGVVVPLDAAVLVAYVDVARVAAEEVVYAGALVDAAEAE
jgi:hypothetical protein